MKATGVVRRIDDLGRIVIPKELRRTMRIREGDSLEIFIEGEKIMLKKYSPVQNVNDFVVEFVESIYSSYKKDMIITDNEVVIAGSGNYKKDLTGKKISPRLEEKLTKRATQYLERGEYLELTADYDIKRPSVIKPINVYGDIIGCVIVSTETEITDVEKSLAEFSGVFMSRYLEG
ncbi:MAG: AbrB/MazE/SpoVT family DNA-binding domain-containing protein [Bacilli bacterium]|nr:AbrB/MazE/SpoVT family DNA-binding domain-containing protein [Bacilli bacterium]